MVFADRNERTAQTANVRGCHNAAFFHVVVQQSQSCSCTRCAGFCQTHFLKDFRDTVTNSRCRCQRKVDDTKRYIQTFGCFSCDHLTNTSDFECGTFYCFAQCFKIFASYFFQCFFHNAGAADANIDGTVCFTNAVESTCHEGVIFYGVAEYNQFCTTDAFSVFCQFCCFMDHFTHFFDSIHVDTVTRSTDIYGRTNEVCYCHSFGNGSDEFSVTFGVAFLHQSGKTTNEVYAYGFCSTIQCLRNTYIRICFAASCCNGNGSYGNTLVYNRHAVFLCQFVTDFYQIFGISGDFIVYLFVKLINIRVSTIQQTDTHCDGSHVQIGVVDHLIGF